MSVLKAIDELIEIPIAEGEIGFIFMGFSALAMKTKSHCLVVDPADFLKGKSLAGRRINAILITHEHFDHLDVPTIAEIHRDTDAWVVCNPGSRSSLEGVISGEKLRTLKGGESIEIDGLEVTGLEANHPADEPLMFLVKSGDIRIFHGSDSSYTPAIENRYADVAFVPVGTPSPTASVDDALKMVKATQCKRVVPIHCTEDEASEFKRRVRSELPEVTVLLPKPMKVHKL